MTRYLLDTNIISELVRNPTGVAARRAESLMTACFTSVIVLAEIRFGLRKNPSRMLAAQVELVLDVIEAVPWQSPADEHYGELRTHLEREGKSISGNDMLIAAHALALDATLVTANESEFRRVPGLRVENWTV